MRNDNRAQWAMRKGIGRYALRIALFAVTHCAVSYAAIPPELPRTYLDTTMPVQTGQIIQVRAGDNLQNAINQAVYGDTIVLEAGATFVGNFVLPEKTGTGWILIQSSDVSNLPAGTRVTPTQASRMPKLVSYAVGENAIQTSGKAHHYRLIGLEVASRNTATAPVDYALITLGSDSETNLSRIAHDLIVDRCYLHGTLTGALIRGIALNSARSAVIDSYISEVKAIGADTQALGGWNGPGPYKIVNNYLEAAGENIMFGGVRVSNPTPADIEIRYNHLAKKSDWKIGHVSFAGTGWMVKNLFELKNAQRVLVENNVLENNWGGQGQAGHAILFNGVDGANSTIENITLRYNHIKTAEQGFKVSANVMGSQLRTSNSILLENNLFELSGNKAFDIFEHVHDVIVNHQTVIGNANAFGTNGQVAGTNVQFLNSIATHGSIGIQGYGVMNQLEPYSISYHFPGGRFTGNALIGGPASHYTGFPGNFFPANENAMGFVNPTGRDYRLSASSPYRNAGSDGKNVGADIDELMSRITGVTAGSPVVMPPPAYIPLPNSALGRSPLDAVRVYPNPWRKDRHTGDITFNNLPTGSRVKIFTISGHLIREMTEQTGHVLWDNRNRSGDSVASGVYIYLIQDPAGNERRGKLAIIR